MDLAKHWRQRATRYRLEGQRNRTDGTVRFPPQPPRPGESPDDWTTEQLSGHGTLYSYTVVRQAPQGFEGRVPYLVGMVALAEGPLVSAQLTDCDIDAVAIGMPVEMVTRRLADTGDEGLIVYGYAFRPVLE